MASSPSESIRLKTFSHLKDSKDLSDKERKEIFLNRWSDITKSPRPRRSTNRNGRKKKGNLSERAKSRESETNIKDVHPSISTSFKRETNSRYQNLSFQSFCLPTANSRFRLWVSSFRPDSFISVHPLICRQQTFWHWDGLRFT